jgi:uncharacterized protein YaeQ
MAGKFSFRLRRAEPLRDFPSKLTLGQQDTETTGHLLLKTLGYLLFFRDRLQVDVHLHDASIPYRPDLVQLDYELRVRLWVECGECNVNKLDRLAVKVPEAEIWILKRSLAAAQDLWRAMNKAGLRQRRYHLVGLDADMFNEAEGLVRSRNELFWVQSSFDPPQLQFDLNGLWFDAPFDILTF